MSVTLCERSDGKPARELAALVRVSAVVDPFTFPTKSYTQTDRFTGVVTSFTTRSCWIDGKHWSDADIVFYEKMKMLKAKYEAESIDDILDSVEASVASNAL